jgi:hypothetical protein
MSERQMVYVVESLADDTPTTLSIHSTRESAQAAVPLYMADYRLGDREDCYRIQSVLLDWTIYEETHP